MSEFTNIHVALHGHFDNKLSVPFAYNADDGEWEKSLPDPDAIVRNFMSARECYVMWQNALGHYFGVITTDPLDPHAGRVMVTVMVDNGYALTGRSIFTALSGLKKVFLEDRLYSDEAVNQVLKTASIPTKPLKLASWDYKLPAAGSTRQPMCYRTYLSTRELETVFSFPNQAEYDNYQYAVVITATSSLRPGVTVDRLTSPVKKVYSVICPAGVEASESIVADGALLVLSFEKNGYNPRKENITVGTPSPYIKYEGSALIVKSPGESGMGFTRRVRLNVRSAKGGIVNGYTISVNNRPVNTMEPFIELTEADLRPGSKVEIQVASNNYHPLKVEHDADTLTRDAVLDLVLVPIEQGIILKLDFGEGRVFEQEISIEKNTPEYSQLHSGNFHGFRAHRLSTQGFGEIYNVDVRAAGKPVAPSFDNVAAANAGDGRRERVVPVFERATDHSAKAKNVDTTTATREKAEPKAKTTTLGGNEPSQHRSKAPVIAGLVCAVAVIIAAIIWIPKMVSSGPGDEGRDTAMTLAEAEAITSDLIPMENAEPAAQPAAEPAEKPAETAAPAATEGDAEDVTYLNSSKTWNADKIKSETYRKLISDLRAGDIQGFVSNPYFTQKKASGKEIEKIADWLWAAKNTPSEKANSKAMIDAASKENINIHDLYEDLARKQPAKPNTEPRP